MDKYYTPELKDLHIGYEFQVKDTPTEDWMDSSLTIFHDLSNVNLWTMDGELRTKYLDKEDIESLGWKLVVDDCDYKMFKKEKYILDFWDSEGGSIKIFKSPYEPIFEGKAKSINELKKILEWIL